LANTLRGVAGELNCGDAVLTLPNVSRADKAALLAAADIFYSPADNVQETFGITLIEAMAAGLPVLASDWNGYREIVHHGDTGFLVPTYTVPTNGPDSMFSTPYSLAATTVVDTPIWTRYACQLFANAELRSRLGHSARRLANTTYDWPQVIKEYERLWDELFNQSRILSHTEPAEPPGFDSITLEIMFAHYGTSHLAEQFVEVNPSIAALIGAGHVKQALFEPKGLFDEPLMAAIISVAQTNKRSTVSELVTRVSRSVKRPQTAIHMHIARMVKFGVLRVCRYAAISRFGPSLADSVVPAQTTYIDTDLVTD
jgi:D-inositol-3-phosphate glycosyltransferase